MPSTRATPSMKPAERSELSRSKLVRRGHSPSSLGPLALLCATLGTDCTFDKADRWVGAPPLESAVVMPCTLGSVRCVSGLEQCAAGANGPEWSVIDDCRARGLVCSSELGRCAVCEPQAQVCDGQTVLRCDEAGESQAPLATCDTLAQEACRDGRCAHLCTLAAEERSNVGCEYWAVDLDNAVADVELNAAAQQFAVVISNPQPDLVAEVRIELDDSAPGQPAAISVVAEARIAPFSLAVFPLGPREVDGSPPGEFNTGTHTALSRAAYRISSNVPVVAYQFNPLENVNVFSNDASLLKPVEALRGEPGSFADAYVVLGWPQTISRTDDPYTNFSTTNPLDFRAFLTLVAARDATRVRVTSSTRVIGGGPVPTLAAGESIELVLDAFDVLNLESDDFGGDFTGTVVAADGPIAAFSGTEASDTPRFDRLSERRCCADHLEEQLDPVRAAGRHFIAPVSFNRHLALSNAGAPLALEEEPEVFRVISAFGATSVRTSLPGELSEFRLEKRGAMREIVSTTDFWIDSDDPIMLGNFTASQSAAGIPSNLPGGDPSFVLIPPIEQFRSQYVFLTPDRYLFDFLRIIAPVDARVLLDNRPLTQVPGCSLEAGTLLERPLDASKFGFRVYRCQLSFPIIDMSLDGDATTQPGLQSDGVHRLFADLPVGVIVDGFDRNVSYGYAAGTDLREITPE